jgi:hypothetical protein
MKFPTITHSWFVAVGAGLLAFAFVAAEKGPARKATEAFMRGKMVRSDLILQGLVLEKFDLVAKNATQLRDMTHSNLWYTMRQPDYLAQTTNFQKSVDALYMAAVDKNLDSATEAYMKVARTCVDCHRLVRSEQHSGQSK